MSNFSQFKYEQETESKHQRFLQCNTKTDRQTPYTEVKMGRYAGYDAICSPT